MQFESPPPSETHDPERSPGETGKSPAPAARPAGGLGTLARRISRRTTDLLAIGIVLIAGLTLGRQTLRWWQQDAPPIVARQPVAGAEWGTFGDPVQLEFGNSPFLLTQERVQGDYAAALQMLTDRCRNLLDSSEIPDDEITNGESKLLTAVAEMHPALEVPGDWKLYDLRGGLRMIVGIRSAETQMPASPGRDGTNGNPRAGATGDSQEHSRADQTASPEQGEVAAPSQNPIPPAGERVLCWGFVFPFSQDAWTLYLFHRRGGRALQGGPSLPDIPLPTGSTRILSLRSGANGSLTGFRGTGSAEAWQQHFTTEFTNRRWRTVQDWERAGDVWTARFAADEHSSGDVVDVQLSKGSDGSLTGLLSGE